MSDTYSRKFWDVDYAPQREEEIDPMESDEAMDEYIERNRREFYGEWNRYLEGACE